MTLEATAGDDRLGAGRGEARWIARSPLTDDLSGAPTGGHLARAECRARHDAGSPSHRRRDENGPRSVLEARLTFWPGHETITAGTGHLVFAPRGVIDRLRVVSGEARSGSG